MAAPLSPTRLFVCTACGATLPVGEEHLGKKCRCGRCGKISIVSEDAPRRQRSQAAPEAPKYFGFFCRVCDTRLAAQAQDVGRKAKCPDCGALTEVPPPPKPQPPKIPKAMHGQQYGLWDVDQAPSGAELAKRQPKLFPVYCRVCDTLMHAKHEQVGKKLLCPDCGAKTTIPEPPLPKPKNSPLVPDGQEYQLDSTHVPPTRPEKQFDPPESKREIAPEDKLIRDQQQERPELPKLPILVGVSSMLLRSPIPAWSLGLTVWLALEVGLMFFVLKDAGGDIFTMILMIACYAMAFSIGLIGFAACAALWLAIFTESSEGNDRLQNPPGVNFADWMGDTLFLVTSSMLAFAPWWLLGQVLKSDLSLVQIAILQAGGWLLTFPLLFLSCLENGSPLEPFSPRIMGSVTKLPGHWLLLFFEAALLVSGLLAAVYGLAMLDLRLALLAIPLSVVASLFYFRILGRFAWWLAESLPENDE